MATVIERVRAGATLLDASVVGWAEKIDVKTLDINNCMACILGQTFGVYGNGLSKLGLSIDGSRDFGFHIASQTLGNFSMDVALDDVRNLNAAWLHEIALRLETPAAEEARIEALPVPAWESPL